MTPEQILEALRFLNDAWYRTPKGCDLERAYAEQIEIMLEVQRAIFTKDLQTPIDLIINEK